MAPTKARTKPPAGLYFCGMCDQSFITRGAFQEHAADHADNIATKFTCPVCNWTFTDSYNPERHMVQPGHRRPKSLCESCKATSVTVRGLEDHTRTTMCSQPPSSTRIPCDRCSKTFNSRNEYTAHRGFPAGECADFRGRTPSTKQPVLPKLNTTDSHQTMPPVPVVSCPLNSQGTPTTIRSNDEYCSTCGTVFASKSKFNLHALQCSMRHDIAISAKILPSSPRGTSERTTRYSKPSSQVSPSVSDPDYTVPLHRTACELRSDSQSPRSSGIQYATFTCRFHGCTKRFKSAKGLLDHQNAVRHYKKSFSGPQAKNKNRAQDPPIPLPSEAIVSIPLPPKPSPTSILGQIRYPVTPPFPAPRVEMSPLQEDMQQAKSIYKKILHLLVQTDVRILHDGAMHVSGVEWTRVPIVKQSDITKLLDGTCHLPRIFQNEYLPPPKTFKDSYTSQYPVADFRQSPDHDPAVPGTEAVVIACIKVNLAHGSQEVVKMAAVDVLTCRVLMCHLVCTNANVTVQSWNTSETGIASWHDMEQARQAGYKVLRGWQAARSALWKFVDKQTIILGHNLRADLDALRMIHGRAIDITKVVEKAAKGPLSKAQLSLDSLTRSYASKQLQLDPIYGRDCLVDAFATREFLLWVFKNQEKFAKDAKQKSLDYQKVVVVTAK